MLVAPAITWLFVSTWPEDVRIIPVPAPRPNDPVLNPSMTVLTSTTAGSTTFAIACWLNSLVDCPFEGPAGGTVLSGAWVPVGGVLVPPLVRTHPMPIPPLKRTSAAISAAIHARPRRGGGAVAVAGSPAAQAVGGGGPGSAHPGPWPPGGGGNSGHVTGSVGLVCSATGSGDAAP